MNGKRRTFIHQTGLGIVLSLLGKYSWAQAGWPSAKPITYIVPFTPGGSTDIIGRSICGKLSDMIAQSIVVENKPGAGGGVGSAYVAKAPGDGYTLLGGTISTHAINPGLYANLQYDAVKDFEPVILVATLPNVLLVGAQSGINNVSELIAVLKKDPKRRTFASSGAGTSTHLAGELFADLIGVPLTHIPYKGTPPAMLDVASGEITFMFDQMTAAIPLIQAGKLKVIAVTTKNRIPISPNTPTMIESGLPNFEMVSWQAIYAPKGTPDSIVLKLNTDINKILKMPEIKEKLNGLGMIIAGGPPSDLSKLMASEIPRWSALIKKSGATAN